MTKGIESPQLVIVYNTAEKFEETGVVGWIELFGSPHYSVVVRPGLVILDGAATLNPARAKILSQAIESAAVMAQSYHGHFSAKANSDEDLS